MPDRRRVSFFKRLACTIIGDEIWRLASLLKVRTMLIIVSRTRNTWRKADRIREKTDMYKEGRSDRIGMKTGLGS